MSDGAWMNATTDDGTRVYIAQDPYVNEPHVLVNGERVEITDRIVRYRDGGTTVIPTSAGKIVRPTRLSKLPEPDRIDDKKLTSVIEDPA